MAQQAAPATVALAAAPGSRLEELQAGYEAAKAAAEDATTRFEALTKALKAEMAAAAPQGSTDIALAAAPGRPRLKMTWKTPYRFDAKRFLADHPDLYVRYEKQGGHWELRVAD